MDRTLSAAVEAIYRAATDPTAWPIVLQRMADCFGDVGAVLVWQRDDGSFGVIESPSLAPLIQEYLRDFAGQDLRAIRGVERGFYINRDVASDLDFVSREEMETHPYYKLLARHGLKYCLAGNVSPDPRINVSISIQRAIGKAPYDEVEFEKLALLAKHAELSLRLSIQLLNAEIGNLGLKEALSRLGIGVFALDRLGRVVFSNAAGDRLLGDGLSVVDECLRIAPSPARDSIEAAISRIVNGHENNDVADFRPMLVERTRGGRPLAIYVMPMGPAPTAKEEFLAHARALILVIDPTPDAPPDPSTVKEVLGLTLSEARLASLIGAGFRPAQAAEKLGITEGTARTALKRVFAKLGISRQSELAALLTKLLIR